MGKRSKILRLREGIMIDIYDINLVLDLITSDKVEKSADVMALCGIALKKGKRIDRNNQKIGKILTR